MLIRVPQWKKIRSGLNVQDVILCAAADVAKWAAFHVEVQAKMGTDNTSLRLQLSADGGSTFGATGYYYAYSELQESATPGRAEVGAVNAAFIVLAGGLGNAAGEVSDFVLQFLRPANAFHPKVRWEGVAVGLASDIRDIRGSGRRSTAQITTALRFSASAGTPNMEYIVHGKRA